MMSALVYNCKESVDDLVSQLRQNGAPDREIVRALLTAASEIENTYWEAMLFDEQGGEE